jgi:dsRNA-specific ribonuclease
LQTITLVKGDLSEEKKKFVGHKKLSKIADEKKLTKCILLGKCETWDAGKGPGEILESVIGAVYLDCYQCGEDGIKVCEAVLRKFKLFDEKPGLSDLDSDGINQ